MSWCNFDLSSDLAIMTLTCKIFSRLYLGNCKGTKLILGTHWLNVAGVQHHGVTFIWPLTLL